MTLVCRPRLASALRAAALALLLLIPAGMAAAEPVETKAVATLQDGLLEIMSNPPPGGSAARSAALGKLIGDTFDINAMGEAAVGIRTYRTWDGFQRRRFIEAFARFMVATHASRFVGTTEQGFEIEGSEDAQAGRKIVHARYLRADSPAVPIDYLVQPTEDGWRILDVYLDETISLLALHRSEFSSVLRDRGFEGFIAAMHAKADELAARPDEK
jgi:phospholipid transport system substrate-binding protein